MLRWYAEYLRDCLLVANERLGDELISSVDEVGVVDDLAKNEGIFEVRHITLIDVTLNGVIGK